jgi:hypothetical protein
MTVQDVIDDALSSELENLAINDKTSIVAPDTITVRDRTIMNWINQALKAISRRVPIEHKEVVFNVTADAIADTGGEKYQLPSNCLQVVSVYNEGGSVLPINDENSNDSVFVPRFDILQVPFPEEGTYVSVVYNAAPDKLTALDDVLPVSHAFSDALMAYIGYKAQAPLGVEMSSENNTYYLRFKAAVDEIIDSGMAQLDGFQEEKFFGMGGWR